MLAADPLARAFQRTFLWNVIVYIDFFAHQTNYPNYNLIKHIEQYNLRRYRQRHYFSVSTFFWIPYRNHVTSSNDPKIVYFDLMLFLEESNVNCQPTRRSSNIALFLCGPICNKFKKKFEFEIFFYLSSPIFRIKSRIKINKT